MLIVKSDKRMIEEEPWHRHSSPTVSGNFIVGERGCSSKRGRKPKWKHGLGKHKHQYRFAKHNNPFWFNWKRRPPVLCPKNREKVPTCMSAVVSVAKEHAHCFVPLHAKGFCKTTHFTKIWKAGKSARARSYQAARFALLCAFALFFPLFVQADIIYCIFRAGLQSETQREAAPLKTWLLLVCSAPGRHQASPSHLKLWLALSVDMEKRPHTGFIEKPTHNT